MFRTIELKIHRDLCCQFREAAYVESFGDAKLFHGADGRGAERYLEWLGEQIRKDPESCVHLWQNGQIIGQIETSDRPDEPQVGYVNLYFLLPAFRGQGFADLLDAYVVRHFQSRKRTIAQLSVSPSNLRAVTFYRRMGWQDRGPRSGHSSVHLMEKKIS